MSLNIPSVRAVKVLDPRLEINTERPYVALKGSQVNSWQEFAATNKNDSSTQITCNPPSRKICISRLVFKKMSFTLTVTGTNTSGGPLLNAGYYAPRAYPLASITQSEQMTINNDTITQAPLAQYWPALLRYHNYHKSRSGQLSLTPSMLDTSREYDGQAQNNLNPLAQYGFSTSYDESRGGYAGISVDAQDNDNTSATVRLTVIEPMLISPFVFGDDSNYVSALVGVQNMSYTATFGNLQRLLSIQKNQGVGTINITGVSGTVESSSLLFNYLTPDQTTPIPDSLVSSYFSIVSYPTKSSVSLVAGASTNLPMSSVQVTSIPRRMYVWAGIDDNDKTAFTTDTFLALNTASNPLSVTWNNNQFFSQASAVDLYNMSVKNGLDLTFSQFTKYVGSPLCIDFGTDLGLNADEAGGVLGNYQLGLNLNVTNTGSVAVTPTLYVVVVYEGTFNIINGNCSHMIGVLSREDVLNSQRDPNVSYKLAQSVYGGDFFSSLKKGFNKAKDFVKKHHLISNVASQIDHPLAQKIAKYATQHGYGVSGGRGRRARGGDLTNGSAKDELKRRLAQSDEVNESESD